jgi:hypothetical protein|tara:strand:+ start:83 stop:316 length:234 start_codon:yes stop_codon:yes gene_type:complete
VGIGQMADLYLDYCNLTFSLYQDRIMYNVGSGSVNNLRRECTRYWFDNQSDIDIGTMINISYQVSGSYNYVTDKMEF